MFVKEIMTKNPACCTTNSALQDVAKMMVDNDCGCIPVVSDQNSKKPVGMVSDRDITTRTVAEGKNPLDLTAADIMTPNVITVTPDTALEECCNLMEEKQIRRVAVIDEKGACCGIIAQADIANNASERKTAEVVQEVSKAAA
ncbi:MAG: CBS domain-containing protein [Pyrinomonadaceae bacterium]